MRQKLYASLALAGALLALALAPAPASAAPLFADEFAYTSFDWATWWPNAAWDPSCTDQLQYYSVGAVTFGNGMATISTTHTDTAGFHYTSGALMSHQTFSYGYFETRAKLPKGKGLWPAFWLLAENKLEIDAFELLGDKPNTVELYYHVDGKEVWGGWYTGPDFTAGYHTFGVDWQPTYVRWYVDGAKRAEYKGKIPSTPQSIIANTAVGAPGSFPGTPDSTTKLPQYFSLDYIRVWKTKPYVPPAPPAGVTFSRIAGPDRYATAVEVSKRSFPATAPCVVVAFGGNYPDALAAAPLAHAYGGPVLLSLQRGLPATVAAELRRLAPQRVFIVGSPASVGCEVEDALRSLPSSPTVTRLGGVDRYGTARLIAAQLRERNGQPDRFVLVNTYPDALSAAPLAAERGWPILITRKDYLPAETVAAVKETAAKSCLVIGSTATISDAVSGLCPGPTRIGGKDRYDTSARLGTYGLGQGLSFAHVALATGANFPDGLVTAPYLAADRGMLLLTRPEYLPATVSGAFVTNRAGIARVDAIGSVKSVSEQVMYEVAAAFAWS